MLRWICRIGFLCLGLFKLAVAGFSQQDLTDSTKNEKVSSIQAGIQHGFIFAHSEAVENTKGARPTGVEIGLSWQRNSTKTWDLCNCFPQSGFLLAYYDYDNRILGKSINASYFLEPLYRIGGKTFFSFKGSIGLSYLTNPFDSLHNSGNQSYSSAIGGYLAVGIGLWFRLNDHWRVNGSINYQHISNGGLKQPNKGINLPTAGVSLNYQQSPMSYSTRSRNREKFWKSDPLRWDIGVFGMALKQSDENDISRRRPMVGLIIQGSRQVGRISSVTLGTEILNDKALRLRLRKDSIDASATRAGVLIGHEFLLGKFIFSQRLGVYVFNQAPYYSRLYHRWGINYGINKHWGVGFNLKAHKHVADFVDLRLIYSFQIPGMIIKK